MTDKRRRGIVSRAQIARQGARGDALGVSHVEASRLRDREIAATGTVVSTREHDTIPHGSARGGNTSRRQGNVKYDGMGLLGNGKEEEEEKEVEVAVAVEPERGE